jgi:hypothetical protein
MKDVSGITGAAPIWHDFMTSVLDHRPPTPFPTPSGVVRLEVCADSGLRPSAVSGSDQGKAVDIVPCPARRLEWFIAGTEPSEVDRQHVRVMIDGFSGKISFSGAPNAHPQVIWQLGPEYQAWARENNIPQLPTTSASAGGQNVSASTAEAGQLRLVSPDSGRMLRIDPGLPRASQQVPVTVLPGFAAREVTLTVDGAPLAVVRGPEYTAWWALEPGRHVLTAWAVRDDGTRVESPEVIVVVE